MEIDRLVAFFKMIEFFEDCDGNDYVMFLKLMDAG